MSFSRKVVCPYCKAVNRIPAERLGDNPKCGKCKQEIFRAKPVELTEQDFQHHLDKSEVPVLVDFWAPWCGPCKMMAPVFAQAAAQLEPRVRLIKISTETEQQLAAQQRIQSIPTLALYRGGREIARQAGAMDLSSLVRWTQSQL